MSPDSGAILHPLQVRLLLGVMLGDAHMHQIGIAPSLPISGAYGWHNVLVGKFVFPTGLIPILYVVPMGREVAGWRDDARNLGSSLSFLYFGPSLSQTPPFLSLPCFVLSATAFVLF
jgi:hypothetical protein